MSIPSKVIQKKNIEGFLRGLAKDHAVFVPEENKGTVSLGRLSRDLFLPARYTNFIVPPSKSFLFPESIKKYVEYPFDDKWMEPGKKVLFGVRPCDAHSFVLLDKAVKDNLFYKEKREDALLIVMGCNSPAGTCFCTSVNGGPFSTMGADIFMADIGDRFVVEDISGRAAGCLSYLMDADGQDLVEKEKAASDSMKKMTGGVNCISLPEKLESADRKFSKDGTWEKLGRHCTNCARCTSVCPTCHCCFVIEDIVEIVCDEMGDKAKDFDPCMLNIAVSGGLDGRVPLGYQRVQRRLMDKFCRSMKTVGQPFCVGCGRCIEACVENVDITELLKFVITAEAQCSGDIFSGQALQI